MARSHWAWGEADALPDRGARENLAPMVQGLLGLTEPLTVRDAVPLSAATLPEPRLRPTLPFASDDRQARIRHTHGRSWPDQLRGFCGDFRAAPDLVLRPRSEDEIEQAFAWAKAEGAQLVPRGGGTSVVGGVDCTRQDGFAGVAVLDLTALDRVLEVDVDSQLALIEAGALGPAIESQLAPHGLTLRHYPQSFQFSTLGGWIATRAGGHFATVYTHIDDLVQSVRMLTPAGRWESRNVPGSAAGPSPDRWVLGSEGTLGVITRAWMRVRPRPVHKASTSVRFTGFSQGADAVRAIAQARLYPANCRLLSGTEALLNGVGTQPVLVLGFESADHPVTAALERAVALAAAHGGEAEPIRVTDASAAVSRSGAAGSWRQSFLQGPYLQSALLTMGVVADTFETAIPWSGFPALHARVKERVGAALTVQFGGGRISCRFTHVYPSGPAPYYTWLARCAPEPSTALPRWQAVKQAAMEALEDSGATVTHHHAVGRLHRWGYERQVPAPFLTALAATKDALDPDGLLNPGVLLPPRRR